VCVCSLSYPACNEHTPYCHLWPVCLYHVFPHCVKRGAIFGEKMLFNIKCDLIFFTVFVGNISYSKKKWVRYEKKCVQVCMSSARYSCQILMKLEFSLQTFEKTYLIYENPSNGSRVILSGQTDRRTDGHDEANSHFSQLLLMRLQTPSSRAVVGI
jgi:hypothetical protein